MQYIADIRLTSVSLIYRPPNSSLPKSYWEAGFRLERRVLPPNHFLSVNFFCSYTFDLLLSFQHRKWNLRYAGKLKFLDRATWIWFNCSESGRLCLFHIQWFKNIAQNIKKWFAIEKCAYDFLLDITYPILGQKYNFDEFAANFDFEKFGNFRNLWRLFSNLQTCYSCDCSKSL